MHIGVIGAGSMGGILARGLAGLGHRVVIAAARGPGALAETAAEVGATAASVEGAVSGADVVILAIPTKAVPALPPGLLAGPAAGAVVVDLANYHPELRDGRIEAMDRGLPDSEWVARQGGRPVVKAFNNILAASLREKAAPRGAAGRVALPVAGDPPEARAVVLRLVDDLGFDPVDAGGLGDSWRQQTGTPAYCRDLDAAALRRALAEAERHRIGEYRAAEEARIRAQIAADARG